MVNMSLNNYQIQGTWSCHDTVSKNIALLVLRLVNGWLNLRGLQDDVLYILTAAWFPDMNYKLTVPPFTCTVIQWLSRQQCSVHLWLRQPFIIRQSEDKLPKTSSGYSSCSVPQGKILAIAREKSVLFYVKLEFFPLYRQNVFPPFPLALPCIFAVLDVLFRVSSDAAQLCVTPFLDSVPGRMQE